MSSQRSVDLKAVQAFADKKNLKVFGDGDKPFADTKNKDLRIVQAGDGYISILGTKDADPSEAIGLLTKLGDLDGTKWKDAPVVGGAFKEIFGDKKIGEVMAGVSALSLACTTDWSEKFSQVQTNLSTVWSGLRDNVSKYPVASSLLAAGALGLYLWSRSNDDEADIDGPESLQNTSAFGIHPPAASTSQHQPAAPDSSIYVGDDGTVYAHSSVFGLSTDEWVPIRASRQTDDDSGAERMPSRAPTTGKSGWSQATGSASTVANLTQRVKPHGMNHGMLRPLV